MGKAASPPCEAKSTAIFGNGTEENDVLCAEEIEFYTLNYPKSRGLDWDVEAIRQALAPELAEVQACMPQHILFLDASEAALRARKAGDTTRDRGFFEHYLTHLLPLKREWFRKKQNVTFLSTDSLTAQQAGEKVKQWCEQHP